MTVTTDTSGGPGAFRRLMNSVATWSEALNYSGMDYTLDRIASFEREIAEIKDRMRQLEASRHDPPDVPRCARPEVRDLTCSLRLLAATAIFRSCKGHSTRWEQQSRLDLTSISRTLDIPLAGGTVPIVDTKSIPADAPFAPVSGATFRYELEGGHDNHRRCHRDKTFRQRTWPIGPERISATAAYTEAASLCEHLATQSRTSRRLAELRGNGCSWPKAAVGRRHPSRSRRPYWLSLTYGGPLWFFAFS